MPDTRCLEQIKRCCRSDYATHMAVAGFSALLFILVGEYPMRHLDLPWRYSGDGMFHLAVTKGIMDTGWVFDNPYLGMPYGQHELAFDHPEFLGSSLQLAILKLLALFLSSPVAVVNMYYFLTFPLTALAASIAFRQMGFSQGSTCAASILFAFVPFHWARSVGHLHLNALYVVPLVVMVAVWIYREEITLVDRGGRKRSRFSLKGGKAVAAGIICAVTAVTQVYFAFFACFFLLFSGASAASARKTMRPVVTALLLVALVSAMLTAVLIPRFAYNYHHGSNPEVAKRQSGEAEIFGLKLIQLLLPLSEHRIDRMSSLTEKYEKEPTPLINENRFVALGVVGAIGFVMLLWRILFRRQTNAKGGGYKLWETLDILAGMNLAGVLYATIGGFAALFALTISPQLRAVNRIAVFLAFFAFGAIACLLDLVRGRLGPGRRGSTVYAVAVLGLVAFGIFDQTPVAGDQHGDLAAIQRQFESDKDFVRQIESTLPRHSMVFQLPFMRFPESGPVNGMRDYSHFSGYIHSKHLRWSYGAVKSRPADAWQRRKLVGQSVSVILESLVAADFAGIYVDRRGYADGGRAIEGELTEILGADPIVGKDGRLSFYNLTGYSAKLESQYGPLKWAEIKERAFCTITPGERVTFCKEGTGVSLLGPGCSLPENWGCWTDGSEARLIFRLPPTDTDLELVIEAKPYAPQTGRFADVFFNDEKIARWDVGGKSSTRFTASINLSSVKPGQFAVIKLKFNMTFSPAGRGNSSDSRHLGMGLEAMTLREVLTEPGHR